MTDSTPAPDPVETTGDPEEQGTDENAMAAKETEEPETPPGDDTDELPKITFTTEPPEPAPPKPVPEKPPPSPTVPEIDPKISMKIPTVTVPEIDLDAVRGRTESTDPKEPDEPPAEEPPRAYKPRHAAPASAPGPVQDLAPQAPKPQPPPPAPPQAPQPLPTPPAPPQQRPPMPQQAFAPPPQEFRPVPNYGPPAYEEPAPPQDFNAAHQPPTQEPKKSKKGRIALIAAIAVLVLIGGTAVGQLVRPLPDPTLNLTLPTTSHTFQGQAPALPLPVSGQAALHIEGIGTMAASGGTVATPTASVAKVMTAYVFLRSHPLASGQPGPIYTVSPQAAAQIPARKQRGESILDVTVGMRLSERNALEALMIISANDVAHELARWDAGNPQAFVQKMNQAAKSLGMTRTRYTDPSGYDSGTVSTAADQVKLLRAAMKIPAFAEIVSKRTYVPENGDEPRAGGNVLLGQYGVMGGKTGFTDAAGGNFVFAANLPVGGKRQLVLGAVMGQRSASAVGAMEVSRQLLVAAGRTLTTATLAPAGGQVGQISDGLGGLTPVKAGSAITVVGWPGLTVKVAVQADAPHAGATGARIGTVKAGTSSFPLVLGQDLTEPSLSKRLTRLN